MTAPLLLAYICAALLLQLAVGIAVAVWRRRGDAPACRVAAAGVAPTTASGAWPGWREFRVARREFEDAARTQCSFYLEPVDGAAAAAVQAGPVPDVRPASRRRAARQRAITRCYSLSDRPDPTRYRVTIKRVPPPADRPDLPPGVAQATFTTGSTRATSSG